MRLRTTVLLGIAILCLATTAGWAQLAPYSQDFEGLMVPNPEDPDSTAGELANDGWLVFANVFNYPDGWYWYNYGPFPAPNGTGGFSEVRGIPGTASQGSRAMVVYNDYNNGGHGAGNQLIEANVFQEQIVSADDVGATWLFEFDARRALNGGIDLGSTALAFFKTLDPNAGYALTNFITVDMTNVPDAWGSYRLAIFIDPSLAGQILQFGFLNNARNYEPSAVLYDNVVFRRQPIDVAFDVRPASCPNPLNPRSQGVLPTAILGTADFDVNDIDLATLTLEGATPVQIGFDDVAGPFSGDVGGDVCGCTDAGPDGYLDLELKFDTQDLLVASENGKLTLSGALLDGTPIEGIDCIVLVGRGPGPAPTTQGVPTGGNSVGFQQGFSNGGSEKIVPNEEEESTREFLSKRKSVRRVRSHQE